MENVVHIPLKPYNGEKDQMKKVEEAVDQPPKPNQKYQQLISSLPLEEVPPIRLRNYRGFWYMEYNICGVMGMREDFTPRSTDIFLVSTPKSGTTWLKALSFAVATRKDYYPFDDRHPLLNHNPHHCVPVLEELFAMGRESTLDALPSPRLLSTHTPYSHLPEKMRRSECRIVYVCREPKDTAVSGWHFFNGYITPDMAIEPVPFTKYFDKFCEGVSPYGPVWDHSLEYWTASLRRPEKVLFLKYESMKEDPIESVRRLAKFVGHPFSPKEEDEGMLEEIARLCSFQKLSSLNVNKTGHSLAAKNSYSFKKGASECKHDFATEMAEGPVESVRRLAEFVGQSSPDEETEGSSLNVNKTSQFQVVKNSSFFRKGGVGDWKNYFTTEMAEEMDKITQEKLTGSGLNFGNE